MTFEFTIQMDLQDKKKALEIYKSIKEILDEKIYIFSVLWKISREVIN